MATAYEAREKRDEQAIVEAQRNQDQAMHSQKKEVREVAGAKVIVKEDPDTGLIKQTKIGNGSWSR